MARKHAFIWCSIWEDEDFLTLSGDAQRLYFFLLSQRDLCYAGLLPLRLRRWAQRLKDSPEVVAAALAELDASRFVLADHDAEEVLVRSLIRRDGIWKQPQILAVAQREAFAITSPVLRSALAVELRRLPVEVVGPVPGLTATALLTGAGELPPEINVVIEARLGRNRAKRATAEQHPAEQHQAEPVDHAARGASKGSDNPSRTPSADPSGNPAADPSRQPSGKGLGEGGRGNGVVVPVQLANGLGGGNAPAPARVSARGGVPVRTDAPTREAAARLVDQHVPGRQPGKVTGRLVDQAAAMLAEGIAPEHVGEGLRLWAGKRLGVGLLPEFVGEAMRAPVIDAARRTATRSRTDDRVASAFELAARYAVEDDDETEVGRLLRAAVDPDRLDPAHGAAVPPGALGVLVAGAA